MHWDHADVAHVDSFDEYEVLYRKKSDSDWTVNDYTPVLNTGGSYDYEVSITGLEDKVEYLFRVCSKVTINGQSEALCAKDISHVAVNEPHRTWLIDSTSSVNLSIGRVFIMVESNYASTSALCDINGGTINCPPRTLVSLNINPGGLYEVTATGYFGVNNDSRPDCSKALIFCATNRAAYQSNNDSRPDCSKALIFCATNLPIDLATDGGGAIRHFGASGGDSLITMSWAPVRSQQVGRTFQLNGKT